MKKTLKAIICLALSSAMIFSLIACESKTTVTENHTPVTSTEHFHSFSDANCTESAKCNCGAIDGEPLGHQWGDATCTASAKCSRCGETNGEPLGHQWGDATCTASAKCSRCGETNGEPLGHQWGDASCTTSAKCSRCGETNGTALGHQWSDATCTASEKCSRCGAINGSPLGHNWSNATCTTGRKCSNCGKTDGNSLGHDWGSATCSDAAKCSRCGTSSGSALGHDWLSATCTEPRKCSRCKVTDGIPNGHTYTSVITQPTCTQQGYTTYTCHCGHSYKDSYVNPSHDYVNYMCSKCETVDKEHAYDYLEWLLLEYGTVSGDTAYFHAYSNDKTARYTIAYNYNNDYIYVSGMTAIDTETIEDNGYIAVYLNDFSYYSVYGDELCVAGGYLDPKTFDDNSPIRCSDYFGPDNYENWFMECTRASIVWILAFLESYLEQCIPEITIEDLGFTAWNN